MKDKRLDQIANIAIGTALTVSLAVVGYYSYSYGYAKGKAQCISEYANKVTDQLNEHEEIIYKIVDTVYCESRGQHDNVWGDNKTSYGWLQYKKATFYHLAEKAGFNQQLNWKDKKHQLKVALWAFKNGYGREWTCYQED